MRGPHIYDTDTFFSHFCAEHELFDPAHLTIDDLNGLDHHTHKTPHTHPMDITKRRIDGVLVSSMQGVTQMHIDPTFNINPPSALDDPSADQ